MPFEINPAFHQDPRVKLLRPSTLACYLVTGHWSFDRRHDGFVPQEWTCMRCDWDGDHATELVDAGLWLRRCENGPGYRYLVGYGGDSPVRFIRAERRQPIRPWTCDYVHWRDDHRCRKCRATADLTLDHIWPRALGGSDQFWNLRLLCRRCNLAKGVSLPEPGEEDCVGVLDLDRVEREARLRDDLIVAAYREGVRA